MIGQPKSKAFSILSLFLGIFLVISLSPLMADFSSVINAIDSRETTLNISKQQNVTDNLTVPPNVTLRFLQGGSLNISASKTVTINGHVDAGLFQIFSGSGTVSFGSGSVKEVYPQWWGAVGDGVVDDTVEIHATRDAVGVDGTLSFSSDRVFLISDTLNMNVSGQTWHFSPTATIKLADNSDVQMIFITASDTKIIGGKLDGNKANQTVGLLSGIRAVAGAGLSNIIIRNLEIIDIKGYGIRFGSEPDPLSEQVFILDCRIINTDRHGIMFNWKVKDSQIVGNYITGTGVDGNGIWIGNDSTHVTITENTIISPGRMGIEVWTGSDFAVVSSNIIKNAGSMGISIGGGSYCAVLSNVINGTGSYGIEVAISDFCVIDANVIEGAGTNGISLTGVANPAFDNIISSNIISSAGNFGIQLYGDFSRSTVVNNTVRTAGDKGIYLNDGLEDDPTDVLISLNHVTNCVASGIYILGMANEVICSHNLAKNNNTSVSGTESTGIYNNNSNIFMNMNTFTEFLSTDPVSGILDILEGSDTWNPGSIADGAEAEKDITVTGVALGDFVVASLSVDTEDLGLSAVVSGTNTVSVSLFNNTGGALDINSGAEFTVYVKVIKK